MEREGASKEVNSYKARQYLTLPSAECMGRRFRVKYLGAIVAESSLKMVTTYIFFCKDNIDQSHKDISRRKTDINKKRLCGKKKNK